MDFSTTTAQTTVCEHCGASFKPYRKYQRFCRPKCRFDAFNAIRIDKVATAKLHKLLEEVSSRKV